MKNNEAFAKLKLVARQHEKLTLLFAAKDEKHNQAVVLADLLQ